MKTVCVYCKAINTNFAEYCHNCAKSLEIPKYTIRPSPNSIECVPSRIVLGCGYVSACYTERQPTPKDECYPEFCQDAYEEWDP